MTLAAMLLTALFTSAVRLPSPGCVIAGAPIGKACHPGSCANKACCADSQKNHSLPSQPLAKESGPNQQLIAILTSSLTNGFVPFRFSETSPDFSVSRV